MRVEMRIKKTQPTWERNHLFPSDEKVQAKSRSHLFLAFVFMTYHKKIDYWLQIYIIFEMVTILKVLFRKSLYIFTRNLLPKKLDSRIFTKWIELSDFNQIDFNNTYLYHIVKPFSGNLYWSVNQNFRIDIDHWSKWDSTYCQYTSFKIMSFLRIWYTPVFESNNVNKINLYLLSTSSHCTSFLNLSTT